jgi:hypothetical protein
MEVVSATALMKRIKDGGNNDNKLLCDEHVPVAFVCPGFFA